MFDSIYGSVEHLVESPEELEAHLGRIQKKGGIEFRTISREEALSIIKQNQTDGLVLQPSNTCKAEFICSCCGCCCGMLSIQKSLPKPLDFWSSNFQASVDAGVCIGCGSCEESCQVGAVTVSDQGQCAIVNLNRSLDAGFASLTAPRKPYPF